MRNRSGAEKSTPIAWPSDLSPACHDFNAAKFLPAASTSLVGSARIGGGSAPTANAAKAQKKRRVIQVFMGPVMRPFAQTPGSRYLYPQGGMPSLRETARMRSGLG